MLVAKTVVKFGTKRSEWVTVDNFTFMYDQTYLEFVKAGIVLEMDEETYLDNKGNIVLEYDKKRLGNKTRYKLQHPEYLLFVDKVGSNTNGEKDKTANEKILCHTDDRPHQVSSSSDHRYTTLGFTNALGRPVCCYVIIAGEINSILDVLGVDTENLADNYIEGHGMDDEDLIRLMEDNANGSNKIFPGGHSCRAGDKVVPRL